MGPIKPNTVAGRLVRALVLHFPRYAGGRQDFGNDYHTATKRVHDALTPRGFLTVSHRLGRDPGERDASHYVYRFASRAIYLDAAALVRSWDTGEDVETIRARLHRTEATVAGAEAQGRLPV